MTKVFVPGAVEDGAPVGQVIGCELTHSVYQALAVGYTQYALAFDTERSDRGGWHNTVTNNSRITFDRAGWYDIEALVAWGNADGSGPIADASDLLLWLKLNGGTFITKNRVDSKDSNDMTLPFGGFFAVNDYVEVVAQAGVVGSILQRSRSGSNSPSPEFRAVYRGP